MKPEWFDPKFCLPGQEGYFRIQHITQDNLLGLKAYTMLPGPKRFMVTVPQDLDRKPVSSCVKIPVRSLCPPVKIWITAVPSISGLLLIPFVVKVTTAGIAFTPSMVT